MDESLSVIPSQEFTLVLPRDELWGKRIKRGDIWLNIGKTDNENSNTGSLHGVIRFFCH